jgi:hypothetical protein
MESSDGILPHTAINSISTKTFPSSVTYLMLLSQLPRFAQDRPNGAGNVKWVAFSRNADIEQAAFSKLDL